MKIPTILLILCLTPLVNVQAVVLKNTGGVEIDATIMAVRGNEVTIKRDDGQVFTIGIDTLDPDSQKLVKEWAMNSIPEEAFRITVTDKTVEKYDEESISRKIEVEKVQFEFKIEYDYTVPLKDLKLEYNLFYNEERIGRREEDFEQQKVVTGTIKIPNLAPDSTVEVMSKETLKLEESKMINGYVPSMGVGGPAKDKVIGAWVRLYQKDKLIYEFSKPRSLMEKNKWK